MPLSTPEELSQLLKDLDRTVTDDWGADFIVSLMDRHRSEGDLLILSLTARQKQQLERLEEEYL